MTYRNLNMNSKIGKKFIISCKQRSGSTMLVKALNSLPSFRVYGELFVMEGRGGTEPEDVVFRDWLKNVPESKSMAEHINRVQNSDAKIWEFIEESFVRPKDDSVNVGFKITYNQSDVFRQVFNYVEKNKGSVLHLIRKNHVRGVLSGKYHRYPIARKWIASEGEAIELGKAGTIGRKEMTMTSHIIPFEVILPFVLRREEQVKRYTAILRRRFINYLELYYEDLTDGGKYIEFIDPKKIKIIMDFLGMKLPKGSKAYPRMSKKSPLKMSQYISNYKEFKDYFFKNAPQFNWCFEGED